jgi:hypothetical protein
MLDMTSPLNTARSGTLNHGILQQCENIMKETKKVVQTYKASHVSVFPS